MKRKRTFRNLLRGLAVGGFFAGCGVTGALIGLAIRAANRAFDSAVIALTVYYTLKTAGIY